MDYIVIQVCCFDCKKFENLFVVNKDNLIELHRFIEESFDLDYDYLIYDKNGAFIEYFLEGSLFYD